MRTSAIPAWPPTVSKQRKNRAWRTGRPPHPGWWIASVCRAMDQWRWWNGEVWSLACPSSATAETAAGIACFAANKAHRKHIEWNDHYPDNARVPREGVEK